jgi:carboxymethylenebutenolidase
MGQNITLTASDGHTLGAYLCDPEGGCKGSVIVVQEIFGVNVHIRDVAERFAAVGYKTIAPALYDRLETGFQTGYEPDDVSRGRDFKNAANKNLDGVMADMEAAYAAVSDTGKVGVTGFCWGGFVVWLAACRMNIQAASGYYGGGIIDFVDERPKCQTILHFGERDHSISLEDVDVIVKSHPEVVANIYDADHGFYCDMRESFDPRAANIAGMRTIRLFDNM